MYRRPSAPCPLRLDRVGERVELLARVRLVDGEQQTVVRVQEVLNATDRVVENVLTLFHEIGKRVWTREKAHRDRCALLRQEHQVEL